MPIDGELPTVPEDLVVRWESPAPVDDAELVAQLPVDVGDRTPRPHPFVVIGDSLSHGFKSLAIHDTALSWPAQVAGVLGLDATQFRYPTYDGPARCPGLPLNLEVLVKLLEAHAGTSGALFGWRTPELAALTVGVLEDVKHYWESGEGALPSDQGHYLHNLAIFGWDVRDSLSKSAKWCRERLHPHPESLWDKFKPHLPHLLLDASGERAALRVLVGPQGDATTQVSAAQAMGREGVETLVVALGANCALGSVLKMKLAWTPDGYEQLAEAEKLKAKDTATVFRPSHFRYDYAELVAAVRDVNARHVVLATVPHVTVAPLLHGFGQKPHGSRYFTRYGRIWISEDDFDANRDECLSGEECRQIDSAIDAYNEYIVECVKQARSDGLDWHVLDVCGLLDSLAYRRYYEDTSARPTGYQPYVLPVPLRRLSPWPDTRFFGSDQHGRLQGGLIALDGVHPTTVGYGIMAREVLKVLANAGVVAPGTDIDFAKLIDADTLVSAPPRTLTSDLGALGTLIEHYDVVRSLLR